VLIEDPGIYLKHVFQEQKPNLQLPADLYPEIGPFNGHRKTKFKNIGL
jgi:hypothetical protein